MKQKKSITCSVKRSLHTRQGRDLRAYRVFLCWKHLYFIPYIREAAPVFFKRKPALLLCNTKPLCPTKHRYFPSQIL